MAGTVYMAEIVKCQLQWTGEEHDVGLNTFYLHSAGGAGAPLADLNGLATDIGALAISYLIPSIQESVALSLVTAADWSGPSGLTGSEAESTGGADVGAVQSAQVAVLVNMEQSLRYRGGHPRLYVPPGSAASLASAIQWTGGYVAALQANLDSLFTELNALELAGEACTLVNFRTREHVGGVLQPPSFTTIDGLIASQTPATIRRRVRRAGHRR